MNSDVIFILISKEDNFWKELRAKFLIKNFNYNYIMKIFCLSAPQIIRLIHYVNKFL